ncbi:MAG: HAD-IC family P-type ATPase, partial [Acidimicrobiales bacterium]
MTIAAHIGERLSYPGRRRRRIWVGAGRIHAEVRGLAGPVGPRVAVEVERALQQAEGVEWATLDAVRQRAVAQLTPGGATPEQVIAAIEKVEEACGVSQDRFPVDRAEHPEDREPVTRHLLALGADVAGLGLGIFGKLLQATPLPIEAASVVTMVDNEPRIRHLLESHLGTPATDLGLAVTNAVGQGLAQGPLGVITDGAHRVNLLLEAQARLRAFERAEERRWGEGPLAAPAVPVSLAHAERPMRLPLGAVERHADRSALAGMAAAGIAVATTRRPRRGAAMLLAALPKAARLGREAFAARLGRDLAARDLLVLDTGALRRLDRVDTVVVDASLLLTGRWEIDHLERIGDTDPREIHRRLSDLFDPLDPAAARQRDGWWLGPPDASAGGEPSLRRALRRAGTAQVLVLRNCTRTAAVATLQSQLSTLGTHLVQAAHRQEHMVVVAGPDPHLCDRVGADLAIEGGDGLDRAVRQLQQDGCVVALVAPGGAAAVPALRAADVGVELPCLDGAAWSGDILINEERDAARVLDSIASAREVSRQSVAFSVAGSGIAALLAVTGPPARAASRASGAVNSAALVAMLNGIRAARHLDHHSSQVAAEQVRWHELTAADALDRLGSTPRGLPAGEAARREADPVRPQPVRPSLLRSTAKELASPLTPILAGGAAASAAVGSMGDAAIVSAVSALNAVIGGVQRYSSEKAILSLGAVSEMTVTVLRDGVAARLSDRRLVPGDVILLQSGDVVPADCRVLSSQRLEVDESTVSGESDTVAKDPAPVFSSVLSERSSMLYEGTTVAAGETTALVVAVGVDTVASAMAAEVATAALPAGVEARLRHLTALTLPVVGAGGASILGLGLLRGRSLQQSAGSAVALAVAAVPEGLPVLATMAQLAAARRLSERDVLVRDPRAIEALGRVQVLCTDKTGTLTEGRIRLRKVSNGTSTVDMEELDEPFAAIVAAGVRASPEPDPGMALPHLTDRAVVDGARRCGIDASRGCPGWEHRAEQPFEPARGYHAVLGSTATGALLSVKGAPETVLPRCRTWRSPAGDVPIDGRSRRRLERHMEGLARRGLRVLAVAEAALDSTPGDL